MRAPNLPSVFRNVRTRPRGFNYVPRYYDERKEELDKRIRIIEKEVEIENRDAEVAKARIQHKFRGNVEARSMHHTDKGRTLRLVIILGVLITITWIAYGFIDL